MTRALIIVVTVTCIIRIRILSAWSSVAGFDHKCLMRFWNFPYITIMQQFVSERKNPTFLTYLTFKPVTHKRWNVSTSRNNSATFPVIAIQRMCKNKVIVGVLKSVHLSVDIVKWTHVQSVPQCDSVFFLGRLMLAYFTWDFGTQICYFPNICQGYC